MSINIENSLKFNYLRGKFISIFTYKHDYLINDASNLFDELVFCLKINKENICLPDVLHTLLLEISRNQKLYNLFILQYDLNQNIISKFLNCKDNFYHKLNLFYYYLINVNKIPTKNFWFEIYTKYPNILEDIKNNVNPSVFYNLETNNNRQNNFIFNSILNYINELNEYEHQLNNQQHNTQPQHTEQQHNTQQQHTEQQPNNETLSDSTSSTSSDVDEEYQIIFDKLSQI